ncbi:carbohydrate ABC transporter permease, partial [Rhizobium ruizarguesonis]
MTASVTAARPPSDITKRSLPASLIIHALLIAASLLMLYPLLWMVSASVRPENEIFSSTSLIPSSIDFSSYARGWVGLDVSFGRFFWNSLVISLLVVT